MRRAARWDGAAPLFMTAKHGVVPPVEEVRELISYVRELREDGGERPFEIVLGGVTPGDPAEAAAVIEPLAAAGATWWDERQLQVGPDLQRLEAVLRRVGHGPPAL
jgi:hypothetical protein